ncbi:ATP synthase F0 subunit C [uncultured Capnocytophaga sp.]|jgi:ATP synthase F0, C subunit|uniref:ATP synthase F0 subunit C n=1 Tax=uncultured Capnocytophaga sp. TaxID=159273 RepID=UPI000F212FFF|nr:ATP synthase F0 subunit C [uncultured Capnocytophaga sp.]RKW15019.1 MAG: ATP synthase F0 subunit C [Capnocytophaga sp.]
MTLALAGIGAAIAALAAGFGIGKIGSSAMEAIARQPEAASKIQGAMIIAAALIEGVALFAVVVAFMKG